jgi:hypothetical protein
MVDIGGNQLEIAMPGMGGQNMQQGHGIRAA